MVKNVDAYEDLVWKNSRIIAKNLHKMREGTLTTQSMVHEMKKAGMIPEEINGLLGMTNNDPLYEADTMGYDDGPDLGKDVVLDEGVYEEAKEAFRRIHAGKY